MRRRWLHWGLLTSGFFCACRGSGDERPAFRPGRAVHDTTAIDLSTFATDREIQRRVLDMSFGEAAARLGSLRFSANTQYAFNRGGERYEQRDTFQAVHDAEGSFHVELKTPISELDVMLVGEDFFVRQDAGHRRRKPRRDVDAERWGDLAFTSLPQALELFRPQLRFEPPVPADADGRDALTFALALGEPTEQVVRSTSPSTLPVGPPAKWRELKKPLDLQGEITIDRATGVVLKAELRGRVEIPDRDVRPTELTLSYRSTVDQVGVVRPLAAPTGVPEYVREPPPRDLLGFFKEHLPAPPPEAVPPTPATATP